MRVCAVLSLAALGACSAPAADPDAGDSTAAAAPSHEFAGLQLAAGEEDELCASWTLDNEEELFVSEVALRAGPGFHHSNWFFFSDSEYPGDDGIWPCEEREFTTEKAAVGGGVLFAQSTQATEESQAFAPGVAVRIPPRARVVGQLHMLNAATEPVETGLELTLRTVPEEEVEIRLQPLLLEYLDLHIPPRQRSEFRMQCEMADTNGAPLDFRVHYFLSHYHDLGTGVRLRAIGGAKDGEILFEDESRIGEPLGTTLDPPLELAGVSGLEMSCFYDNPRDQSVGFGYGDQEMCFLFAFTDSPVRWLGIVHTGDALIGEEESVAVHSGPCTVLALPPK